ncbi:MAG TPA: hypothetical protein PLA43_19955 [Bryobacteraceae bacterium]|nr:hypothetical protein [Bryobacteraceae bacterium]HOQ46245.1 hypothetical protein [Bryobacteraceae bacterium]HPQ14920.1 hypothetical protein [Bryobacteraceae bacterium]HPU74234.1 hypothetical protein [Bryobacteraceae bacterium]
MASHVRILAVLHIVFGAVGVLIALAILALFGGIAGVVNMSGEPDARLAAPILGLIGGAIFFFLAILSLPGIIAGIGLLRYREWARIMTIVLSALQLVNVPFGTALGVYGLWVLLKSETTTLFSNPPLGSFPAYR